MCHRFGNALHHHEPVCLNSLLYLMERQTGEILRILDRPADAPIWDKTTRTRLSVPVVDVHIERPERSWVVPVGPQIVSLPVKGPNVVAQPAPHHHKTSHHQKASQR